MGPTARGKWILVETDEGFVLDKFQAHSVSYQISVSKAPMSIEFGRQEKLHSGHEPLEKTKEKKLTGEGYVPASRRREKLVIWPKYGRLRES